MCYSATRLTRPRPGWSELFVLPLSLTVCLLTIAVALLSPPQVFAAENNSVYQIFVRSFADSPTDTASAGTTGEIGDLRGIQEQLDYLNDGVSETDTDLEVGILWLSPIFPANSYHGYDVSDYRAIHPDFGTLEDLQALVAAAHARGVRVLLDLPLNHTSDRHPWFRAAVNNPQSPFRKYYRFAPIDQPAPPGAWHAATAESGQQIRYFGLFSPSMPDLNFDEPAVRAAMVAIGQYWLEMGIDGFRLDAAKHIYGDTFGDVAEADVLKNNNWWREFSKAIYATNPKAVLVGEVLGSPETLRRHAYGNDALLDEPFMYRLRLQIISPKDGFLENWKVFRDACRQVNREAHSPASDLPRTTPFESLIFAASHDANPRLASFVDEAQGDSLTRTPDEAYRLGLSILLSLGTYPILYNGDEVMQRGMKWNGNPTGGNPPGDGSGIYDETLREPFPWRKSDNVSPQTGWFHPRFDQPSDGISVEEQSGDSSILSLTRALLNFRSTEPDFANGEVGTIVADGSEWMIFEKLRGGNKYLVMINQTTTGHDYNFHSQWYPEWATSDLIFTSNGSRRQWKNLASQPTPIDSKVFVPPYGLVILKQPGQ